MAGLVPAIHVLLRMNRKTWMPGTRPGMTERLNVEPVKPLRGAEEQIVPLRGARALRQNLAGVPEHRIAVRALVDGEVALEHPTRRPERRDAGLDIGPPRAGEHLRRRRIRVLLEAEAADTHAEPAELHINVRPLRQRFNRLLPARKDILVLIGI